MRQWFVLAVAMILLMAINTSFAAGTDYCTKENYSRISRLYENQTHDTAKIVFNILNCNDSLSKKTKTQPFVAMLGGLMRSKPDLIEDIYASVESIQNLEAPKIYKSVLKYPAALLLG